MIGRRKTIRRSLVKLLRGETAPIPLGALLNNWRRGFGGWSYVYYELHKDGRVDDYLPDITMRDMAALNRGSGRMVLTNKLVFERVVGTLATVPKTLAFVGQGTLVALTDVVLSSTADLVRYCREVGPAILKPIDGGKGRGVMRLAAPTTTDGTAVALLNDRNVDLATLEGVIGDLDRYLISEFARQASYAKAVFPDATNTVRVVTMIDPLTGIPFIPAAVHRFGTKKSAPTDNASIGGIAAGVNIETGQLGKATRQEGARLAWIATHPDTGAQIEGVTIEHWQELKATVLRVAAAVPFAPYVGWDWLVSETGPVLIEGNADPSLHVQVHHPFLRDARVRAFVEHHGVWRDRSGRRSMPPAQTQTEPKARSAPGSESES